jgi:hypothetical protein
MNYDTRIAIAREWVGTLITRYERPAHLAHDKHASSCPTWPKISTPSSQAN